MLQIIGLRTFFFFFPEVNIIKVALNLLNEKQDLSPRNSKYLEIATNAGLIDISCYPCDTQAEESNLLSPVPNEIRREVLFWSSYHAAASRFELNISVTIGPRLSKSKIWHLCKKSIFLLIFFSPRLIRLISNSDFFETL